MPSLRPLSAQLAKKAADELFEKPERIDEDLAALRAWLAKCPHIKSRTDDQFLTMFLRGCKHSLERAKEKLDMYYTVRTALPELMRNRDPEEPKLLELIKMGVAVPLPNTVTPDGPRIILVRPGVYDPSKYTIQEVFRYNTMMSDIMMKEDDNLVVAGQVRFEEKASLEAFNINYLSFVCAFRWAFWISPTAPWPISSSSAPRS